MPPFDADKLTRMMQEENLDLLLVNTRHNIRYLTGGYFDHSHQGPTRFATSRYLPLLGLPRGISRTASWWAGRKRPSFTKTSPSGFPIACA